MFLHSRRTFLFKQTRILSIKIASKFPKKHVTYLDMVCSLFIWHLHKIFPAVTFCTLFVQLNVHILSFIFALASCSMFSISILQHMPEPFSRLLHEWHFFVISSSPNEFNQLFQVSLVLLHQFPYYSFSHFPFLLSFSSNYIFHQWLPCAYIHCSCLWIHFWWISWKVS